jgi:DnaJ-class molecular chaperone
LENKKFYDILGIKTSSSREEITAAFKKLAKIWHPDKNGNTRESEEKFKEILEAYKQLAGK